ncbi:hypothetical protein [Sphingobium sp. TCM1]|uniref:hypothetical protein n=1 Tax=Sphingobium sp. TCM1 TaxID=453246 RepID=UPI0007F4014E|nr:hypothetical protein [Sphingobium sp. TCM1]OAN53536.1 hypothetical protein A7Q26_05845 [Sphingobium sp. TCM1]
MVADEGEEQAGDALVAQRQAAGGAVRAQKRRPRRDGWSKADVGRFMAVLAETCNASEAARAVGKCRAGAYDRRRRDPAFGRAWDAALDMGYAEIEAMLMREVLFGSETEEITLDGEGVVKARKVKRGRNLAIALRLLSFHHDRVLKIRAANDAGGDRPDSPDAVARVRRALEEIRRRRATAGA